MDAVFQNHEGWDYVIHFLNQKELLITWDMAEQSRIREILASHGIEYKVRTVNTCRGGNARARTGVAGIRTDAMYQYYIYVKKCDYEKAGFLIGR